uniref:Dihydroxyacetone synthase n=1 Tax=Ogataea methanolica TaxID=1156966 RepID=D7UPI2_OGAME|nr:dihydroxyacetone synthase [Ogataea methanolica]
MRIARAVSTSDYEHDQIIKYGRALVLDIVQQYDGGHPGSAMGGMALGIALWKYTMKYAPNDPTYFNRDRFVLSNGHVCLLQYVFQHFTGLKSMTMDQLKSYHSNDFHSHCPGHPEIEHDAVEVTTGPLGQGIANSVGLAIATKNLAATYNKPGYNLVDNKTYCIVGDACLQEGPALEAISIAGHYGLNNLIVLYDNNQVCADGSVDIANTEDISAKFKACNWNVIEVANASEDVATIVKALEYAQNEVKAPTLINCRTVIGADAAFENHHADHGNSLGADGVREVKKKLGMNPAQKFHVPKEIYQFFSNKITEGDQLVADWKKLVDNYVKEYPELGKEFLARVSGELPADWKSSLPVQDYAGDTPTRAAARGLVQAAGKAIPNIMAGCADLSVSVNLQWPGVTYFQDPSLRTNCGLTGDYSGRYLEYGIREHAMCAIANGMAAFNKGTFIPITSTFFMFYLYAAPAIRMAGLQELKTIHIGTHDSINEGENGPTHQPIESPSLFRAMLNVYYMRPVDSAEVLGLFEKAIECPYTSMLSLSRNEVLQYPGLSSPEKAKRGGYILEDVENADVQLIGAGAEMEFAYKAAKILGRKGLKVRVLSIPCTRLFDEHSLGSRRSVLRKDGSQVPPVIVDGHVAFGWERYSTASYCMNTYGKSLPPDVIYEYFGYNPNTIAKKVEAYVKACRADPLLLHDYVDLKEKPKHDKVNKL